MNNILMTKQIQLAMTILGCLLFAWWCPEIPILGVFGVHVSGIRWYVLVNETWFTDPNNMSHAVMMGVFLFFSLVGGKTSINLGMGIVSFLLNLRVLWALYCDIFVETFNLFYILIDLSSSVYITYMSVMIAQSIFNKSVSSVYEYTPNVFAFLRRS